MQWTSIEDLIRNDLGFEKDHIPWLANNASKLYRHFKIDDRDIYVPEPQLKLVQSWISDFLRGVNPIHSECVTAYEKGCSITTNARLHNQHAHVLNLDIKSFFPSCTSRKVEMAFRQVEFFDSKMERMRTFQEDEIVLLSKICCRNNALCIGAPSSPALANRIMLPFDCDVLGELSPGYSYSRYSDDITISSDEWIDVKATVNLIQELLSSYGFELNCTKTHCRGRGDRRRITGIYIQPNGELSIGLQRKNHIKHTLYDYLVKGEGSSEYILGLIYFALQVEPLWVNRLLSKYSKYGEARYLGVIGALRSGD